MSQTFIRRERIELDPLAFSTANTRRTPGVHLTDVVRDMLAAIGVRGPAAGNSFGREELDAFALQGYLWEDEMTETLLNRVRKSNGAAIGKPTYLRLPEIATDGQRAWFVEYDDNGALTEPIPPTFMILSPDGVVLTNQIEVCPSCKQPGSLSYAHPCDCIPMSGERCVIGGIDLLECKRTSKAPPPWDDDTQVRSDLLSKWLGTNRPDWMWQTPCYLKGLSIALSREVNTVQHHIHFSHGDWRVKVFADDEGRIVPLSPVPIYEEWTRTYSEREVDDKWSAVYGHARDRGMFG